MALTHLIVKGAGFLHTDHVSNNYTQYFRQKSAEGKWVILDNSAYEIGKLEATQATGQGLGPDLVLQAAEIINPSIVIAQDVLCDSQATIESTKDFIRHVEYKGLRGKFQIMAVPQGKTKDEWLMCFETLSHMKHIDQIGFSKISVPLSFGGNQAEDGCVAKARLACTQAVADHFVPYQLRPAHLLGGDNWLPWELSQQKQHPWIFSNDSSATVWYGLFKQTFDSTTGKIAHIITTKPDLENHDEHTEILLEKSQAHILHNISVLHKMSKTFKE
jgi:hypothetical protein